MINPYLACRLRHARKVFRKSDQRILAKAAHRVLGELADSVNPADVEIEADRLIHLALGGTIYA